MNKIKKLFIYSINIPLYLLAKIIPKNKNIWIFGAWFGEKYGDNSKYLFKYINKNYPDIRAIWLTTDKNTCKLVKSKGYEAHLTYSFKGYFYSVKAFFSFVSTGFNDVNFFIPTKYIVNLWHGIPLKKIVYDDKLINSVNYNSWKRRYSRIIFPFIHLPEDFNYIVASSQNEAKCYTTAFNKNMQNIFITGLPRNDVFTKKTRRIKKIIYMPTHRNEGELDIAKLFIDYLENINRNLSSQNLKLHIKLHYYHMRNINLQDYSNVCIIKDEDIEQDIYSVINDFDLLITDYSSVYFDFLLTDRPIIFAPFDYEKYITKDRELYYDYDEVTPGPKCKNWNEVMKWIKKFKENPDLYSKERKDIRDRFHKYQDGKSCQRVYQEIQKLINE